MSRRACFALVWASSLASTTACKDDEPPRDAPGPLEQLVDSTEQMLSPGNEDGQDEDPSILVAADGSLWVAWYSNRNGVQSDGRQDREIFVTTTSDGATWTEPVQATRDDAWAFYPSLAQDAAGRFHLAWWQMALLPAGCDPDIDCTGTFNTIRYNTSDDGRTWDAAAATTIAAGPGDWLPSLLIERENQEPVVYFTSPTRDAAGAVDLADGRARLYRVTRVGGAWSNPVRLSGISEGDNDTYAHVVQADGGYTMTWTRYAGSGGTGVLDVLSQPSADVLTASSIDGAAWSTPHLLSSPAKLDVFPFLFDRDGALRVVWLSADPGASSGLTVDLAADGVYPAGLATHPEVDGYTARYAATPTTGVTWAVWVRGPADRQKLWYRFFAGP